MKTPFPLLGLLMIRRLRTTRRRCYLIRPAMSQKVFCFYHRSAGMLRRSQVLRGNSSPMFRWPLLFPRLRQFAWHLAGLYSDLRGAEVVVFRTAFSLEIFIEPAHDVLQPLHSVPRLPGA